jgi:FkbM family methyltransferase
MSVAVALRELTLLLRKVPGGILVGELLRRPFSGEKKVVRVDDFDGDLVMYLDLSEHMQSQIFWYGTYSRDICFLLNRELKQGMVFVDGGANAGEITLLAAKRVGASGRVLSFEPLDPMADQLQRNIDENKLTNVEVLRVGLSRAAGEATIYIARDNFSDGSRHDGLGTLFPTRERGEEAGTVPLITLDAFCRDRGLHRLDMIKLDIEGGELAALEGAREVLATMRPALIIELGEQTCRAAGYAMRDVYDFISGCGYSLSRIERKGALTPIGRDELREFQNLYCVPVRKPDAEDDEYEPK